MSLKSYDKSRKKAHDLREYVKSSFVLPSIAGIHFLTLNIMAIVANPLCLFFTLIERWSYDA
jgi:hypothetical protein